MADGGTPDARLGSVGAGRPVALLTAGNLGIGLSGFVLLAAGPRLLGTTTYSALAVAWTLVTMFGVGVAQPGEQTVTRLVAAGEGTSARAVVRRVAAVALAGLVVPVLSQAGRLPWFDAEPPLAWAAWLALLAWVPLAHVRGHLAGRGEFGGYATTLAAEAVVRIALVAAAFAVPAADMALLGASLAVPLAAAALVGLALPSLRRRGAAAGGAGTLGEHAAITATAVGLQVIVNSAPLWISARFPDPATAGAFVTASSYLRVPLFLGAGLAAFALSRVSAHSAADAGNLAGALAWRATRIAAGIGVVATAGCLVLAPWLLPLLYGQRTGLPLATLLGLAVSTILVLPLGVLAQALFGVGRAPSVALSMAAGAAVTTALCALTTTSLAPVDWAVVLGPAVGLAGVGAIGRRRLSRHGHDTADGAGASAAG